MRHVWGYVIHATNADKNKNLIRMLKNYYTNNYHTKILQEIFAS